MPETWVQSLGQKDALEAETATHSSIPTWRLPRTEEPGGLRPWGCKQSHTSEQLTLHSSNRSHGLCLPKTTFPFCLSSQPCIKMREAKIAPFSSYGLQWCFEQLGKEEFQTFKALLKQHASEPAAWSLPLAQVDGADAESLASLMHEHCRASLAWKASIDVFEKMRLSALSEMARDEMKSE